MQDTYKISLSVCFKLTQMTDWLLNKPKTIHGLSRSSLPKTYCLTFLNLKNTKIKSRQLWKYLVCASKILKKLVYLKTYFLGKHSQETNWLRSTPNFIKAQVYRPNSRQTLSPEKRVSILKVKSTIISGEMSLSSSISF